jgi:hypothetical protein
VSALLKRPREEDGVKKDDEVNVAVGMKMICPDAPAAATINDPIARKIVMIAATQKNSFKF